jgi:tetratricopeptide (TPR) repeat protein
VALSRRFERSGRVEDLDEAIALAEGTVGEAAAPESSALNHNALGILHYHRYNLSGDTRDIERCVDLLREAVRLLPAEHAHRPVLLGNLGNALHTRYLARGRLEDLGEAVDLCRRALERSPADSRERVGRANNLALALQSRYRRSDRAEDLEAAIAAAREAYALAPADHPYRHYAANNLGLGLRYRFARNGSTADLDEAIALFEEADRRAPPQLTVRTNYLDNLAACLADRAAATRSPADATRAVEASRQAVALAGSDEARALGSSNLAWNLLVLHTINGDSAALDEAVEAGSRAVALSAPGHPYLAERHTQLAQALSLRFARRADPEDLARLLSARAAAIEALERNLRTAPLALGLGEQAAWSTLYERTALELGAAGRVRDALLVAERGKSWFLVSLLARTDIPAPAGVPGDMVARERSLLEQLNALDARALADYSASGQPAPPMSAAVAERDRALASLAEVRAELRASGPDGAAYADLRQGAAMSAEDLARIAAQLPAAGVMLSLTLTERETLWFALRRGRRQQPQARIIGFGADAWREAAQRLLREVPAARGSARVRETWYKPLEPVLALAGELVRDARLVVLSPDPSCNDLPWALLAQRAGWPGALCTVPGLGVLDRLLRHRAPAHGDALVVGNPTLDLPYARLEAEQVGRLLGAKPLYAEQATKAAVLAGFARARIAHLAAHAHFASGDPFDSGVRLADGVLSARELLQGGHRVPPVLVLSACQTGLSETLSEREGAGELAGLTQALFYAGARSLIVSLWEVADASSAALMLQFHRAAARAAPGLGRAAALGRAMRAVRAGDARWQHPYHWGAFALVGDWRD